MKTKCVFENDEFLFGVKENEKYKIKEVCDGVSDNVKRRLFELGFIEGENIVVLKKSLAKKSFLVAVNGCVFVLQANVARFVRVMKI